MNNEASSKVVEDVNVESSHGTVIEVNIQPLGSAVINLTNIEEQKRRRQFGKAYIGRHYNKNEKNFIEVNKAEKILGPRCICKAH